jgi:hypothetical protein
MWRSLETEERRAFSESFHPFRAELHKLSIFRQYTNIVYIFPDTVCILYLSCNVRKAQN